MTHSVRTDKSKKPIDQRTPSSKPKPTALNYSGDSRKKGATNQDLDPLLSVIIPTYNRSILIKDALNSLVKQHYRPLEIVVIDDGSTDNTQEVLSHFSEQFASKDLSFKLEKTQNQGAPKARNLGLRNSSALYVLFMDSDDLASIRGISDMMDLLKKESNLDFVHGRVSITTLETSKPEIIETTVGEPFIKSPESIAGYHWHTMGAIYSRDLLKRVGPWNEALTGSQDWEFQGRVKLKAGNHGFTNCVTGFWRQHSGKRVGASTYRKDYVQSVVQACLSLWEHSEQSDFLNKRLQQKLSKKIFRHSLEFGAHQATAERNRSLQSLAKKSPQSFLSKLLAFWRFAPPSWDKYLYGLLQKIQKS